MPVKKLKRQSVKKVPSTADIIKTLKYVIKLLSSKSVKKPVKKSVKKPVKKSVKKPVKKSKRSRYGMSFGGVIKTSYHDFEDVWSAPEGNNQSDYLRSAQDNKLLTKEEWADENSRNIDDVISNPNEYNKYVTIFNRQKQNMIKRFSN
jgi:hypothetical protein